IAHSRNLGYIKCPDNLFIPLNAIRSLPDEKVLILTTGSQGEPLAAMTRIANGAHRQISIKQGDTIIFSANPIPGNTIAVVNTIDKLMMQGANVVYGRHHGIHVSGHGCQEDHKLMLALTRPKFFVPVHGEHRMLVQHSKTAQSMGIPRENMVIINNGDVVELTENSIRVGGKVPSGIEPVDSSRTGFVRDDVLKERQQLAEDGLITVAVAVSDEGKLLAIPETHLKGVVMTADQATFKQQIVKVIEATVSDRWSELSRSFCNGEGNQIDWVGVRTEIERAIARLLRRELQSNPLLVVLMQTPEESPQPATGRRRPRTAARVAS
ncbi:ribonuclease J, partial [Arthrospira sp. O9.13F]